jgi:hypothetical protein
VTDVRVVGAPLPAPQDRRYYPIHRPRHDQPIKGVVLSDEIVGFWTHWVVPPSFGGGRTKPCYGQGCQYCATGRAGMHWYGFVPLLTVPARQMVGLLIHRGGAEALLRIGKENGMLRGVEVRCTKVGPQQWAALHLVMTQAHDYAPLPPAFDLTESLKALWDVKELPLLTGPPPVEGGAT